MRILIADDHDLVRDTIMLFLQVEAGAEVAAVGSLPEAVKAIKSAPRFDLVILDVAMPGMNGLESLRQVMAMAGGQRVALISGTATADIAEQALAMGAAGYLPKTLSAKSLANAVRFMAMGEQYAPLEFLRAAQEEAPHPLVQRLSGREMDVLRGLVSGKANKEIARDLGITEPTVKLHMKTLYRKIGAHNRTQAALIARDQGLF
ncbi:LuxR family two component transcriptional regulator [Gemmobacter caeni]|jgi:DNA-binding NarL/FixJ family response regulator|uniref:LuxR family two component transcriptional regulator n=2 Tax=Gemmobacter TaxID=204456 RepID=A0A2T6ABU1_9RHOB|nr:MULTISPECIES: response regulator transcription factor [Gemmobacter]PTX41242.1 LuxR family two component transcriptional regulator [Gemmobacter caeni]TWI89959.1 LuxR family two component transcriptional regulator [Gemmobacter caeni]GHC38670.1 DNA-binding response regulator [Gemmobacter nanjingensis]